VPASIDPKADARQDWYYAKGDKEHGPLDFAGLQAAAVRGELSATDFVLLEGTAEWLPAGQVPGLLPGSSPATRGNGGRLNGTGTSVSPSNYEAARSNSPSSLALASTGLSALGVLLAVTAVVAAMIDQGWVLLAIDLSAMLVTAAVAVILGHAAINEIRRQGGALSGRRLAITGLALGYLVLASSILIAGISAAANRFG
jgi:hypothetical protein